MTGSVAISENASCRLMNHVEEYDAKWDRYISHHRLSPYLIILVCIIML